MDKPHLLSDRQLLDVLALSPSALAVYTTEDMVIQSANDAMIRFWGKDRSIIGMTFEDAIPELDGQPFLNMLKGVYRTGITEIGQSVPAETKIDGRLQTRYYDFEYKAIRNSEGEIFAILHTAEDVTEKMKNKYDFIGIVSHELKTPITSLTAGRQSKM